MSGILISNALIVTMNDNMDVLEGFVLIENGAIVAIEKELKDIAVSFNLSGARVIEAKGSAVIPGLIQTHVHLCQTLFRGLADDLSLLDWLRKRIWPLEGAHDYDSLYCSALMGIGEMFKCGTTAIVDMGTVHHTDAVFQAIADTGIRAIGGKCMMDSGAGAPESLLESTEETLGRSLDLLNKWHGYSDGRIAYAFTPRFVLSCTDGLLTRTGEMARKHKVRVHTHASESAAETALVVKDRQTDNITCLDNLGLTGEDLILAHCNWLSEQEIGILRDKKINVAHCPMSNLKLASGIAGIPRLLSEGVNVSLGSDGAACNNNMDMFMEMRFASLIQKPAHGPDAILPEQVFAMATKGGAKTMGLSNRIGSLRPGKRADLAIIDLAGLHCGFGAKENIYGKLVYQIKSSDVSLTMVDGRIVYENRRLTTIDESLVKQEGLVAFNRICRA